MFIRAHPARSTYHPGIIIHLFLQCISALFNPVNRATGGIKLLVAQTVAMFSIVTAITMIYLNAQHISYTSTWPCGPYHPLERGANFIYSGPGYAFRFLSPLNESLADGLWQVTCSIRRPRYLTLAVTDPALSVLHYIWQELLGYYLPVLDVPLFFRCVLRFLADQRQYTQ